MAPPRASVFQGPEFAKWMSEQPIRKAWVDSLIEIGKTGTGSISRRPIAYPRPATHRRRRQEIVQGANPADAAKKADEALARLQ